MQAARNATKITQLTLRSRTYPTIAEAAWPVKYSVKNALINWLLTY
jgi:hypothetical protein